MSERDDEAGQQGAEAGSDRRPSRTDAETNDDRAERVRRQREHIAGLTGQDPLAGGNAD